MAKREKNPARLVKPETGFPRGTLIWARLFEAEAMEEGQEKSYSGAVMFKKGADVQPLKDGYDAAVSDQWPGKKPRKIKNSPFIEGDELEDLLEEYEYLKGSILVLKFRRYEKYGQPQLWDQNVEAIESQTEMYSGAEVLCDVEFFGWERPTGNGISCRVNGIQKVREGEPLGGGKTETADSFKRVKVEGKSKNRRAKDDDDDDDDDVI